MKSKANPHYIKYDNLNEAEQNEEEQVTEQMHKFCPLSGMLCRGDCACYHKPCIVKLENAQDHILYSGYCSAYALVGPRIQIVR